MFEKKKKKATKNEDFMRKAPILHKKSDAKLMRLISF